MVSLVPLASIAADWKTGLTSSIGVVTAEGAEAADVSSRFMAVAVKV
jgi:hypothetical protein